MFVNTEGHQESPGRLEGKIFQGWRSEQWEREMVWEKQEESYGRLKEDKSRKRVRETRESIED